MEPVALKLIIGPANAEKAGAVLDGYRAALADGDPILVVPNLDDVDHYRRELGAGPTIFGASVMTFAWLLREIAERALVGGPPLGPLARERVAAAAIARARLGPTAVSASTPGFPAALLELVDELQELRITPARFTVAVRRWARAAPARAAYAEDLAALYAGYHRQLERVGATDARLRAAAGLDRLRLREADWGGTAVFVYGFDDLTALQRDAIETLACHAGAEVTVSLTYERGREAFAARASTFEELQALPGAEVRELAARDDFYAPQAREALHHLERSLFEPDAGRVEAGDAVALLEAGGERAEVELVGAHVARLIDEQGYAPEDIAVVFRSLAPVAALVAGVFGAYGIPFALDRKLRAGQTALGRALLGLLGAALPGGTADHLLAYLRAPGVLELPDLADRFEAELRREGIGDAAAARARWERQRFELGAVGRVATAARRGPAALWERLATEAAMLLTRPHRGRAAVLDEAEAVDARVAGAVRRALRELGDLARRDPGLAPDPAGLAELLGALEVRIGPPPGPGRVAVTGPQALRARRVRALFACGLQEGSWPMPARPPALLGDDERLALAQASGLVLRRQPDALAGERYLFYATASRPTDRFVLSWHTADDDGDPAMPSYLIDDAADLFGGALRERTGHRPLGAAGWEPGLAPTERERRRSDAAAGPRTRPAPVGALRAEPARAELAARRAFSASSLEAWAACPVRWLVERLIDPEGLAPDPEPMLRGTLAHKVLRDVLEALGPTPLRPAALPAARAELVRALERRAPEVPISVNPERLRAELRRLEADLLRYLDHAASAGSAFAPTLLEHPFEVELPGGLRLRGTIDRVDLDTAAGQAIAYDYKGRVAHPHDRWVPDRRLQMGLYVLALRELLDDAEPVGGLYQPLGARDSVPRGALLAEADPRQALKPADRVTPEVFEQALAAVLEIAANAAAELRAGRLEARPATCGWAGGGCSYPSICRCEAA